MSLVHSQPWEMRLLLAAQEAFNSQTIVLSMPTDRSILDAAYQYCEEVTRFHSRTFYMASSLLPLEKRRAVHALYAFCRVTDDIVDANYRPIEQRVEALKRWRCDVLDSDPTFESPVTLAWADAQARFDIPQGYAQQLIDGCARDAVQSRYATFEDLAEYSYGVASTVGLMAMHIVGFTGEDALPYAVKLGVALQITNILRDVGEDWRGGRVYLPQDDMAEFGITEDDIARGRVTDRWRRFMAFQINRNRKLYADSLPGIDKLHANGRFAIAAAAKLYEAILDDIEANDYDVFSRRARISTVGKLRRLPSIWVRSRRVKLAR